MTSPWDKRPYKLPLKIKVLATCFLAFVIPVYWFEFGPENFLWGCDVALLLVTVALWLESRLLASMMAVGVLLMELIWNADYLTRLLSGSHLFGLDLTSYMFDSQIGWTVRLVSFLLHIYLPVILIWMLYRLGYHHKALIGQTLLAWVVLPLTYWLTEPADNINFVFGVNGEAQAWMPGPVYLLLLMILIPVIIYAPSHFLLKRLFGKSP